VVSFKVFASPKIVVSIKSPSGSSIACALTLGQGERISEGASRCIFNSSKKPPTKPWLLVFVVGKLQQEARALRDQQSVRASTQRLAGFATNFFSAVGRYFALVKRIHAIFNLVSPCSFNISDQQLE